MHLETLLYMLLQSEKTLPPPGVQPDFEALACQAKIASVPNEWKRVPSRQVTLGLNDPDNDDGPNRYFGWDNEKPTRDVVVHAFEAKAHPITNEDYARYLESTNNASIPASWKASVDAKNGNLKNNIESLYMNGLSKPLTNAFLNGKAVRTVYGLVPLEYALDWPVFASYDELAGCASWMNGRIPTMEEARSLYNYVDELKAKDAEGVPNGTISGVNGFVHRALLTNTSKQLTVTSPTRVWKSRRHHTIVIIETPILRSLPILNSYLSTLTAAM